MWLKLKKFNISAVSDYDVIKIAFVAFNALFTRENLPYDSRILSFGSLEEEMLREGKKGLYLEKDFLWRRWKMEKESLTFL